VTNPVSATPEKAKSYRERVLPSLISLLPALLIWPTCYLTFLLINPLAGAVIGGFVTAAVLVSMWFAAPLIEVDQTGFSVGESNLPLDVISKVEVIVESEAFAERGVKLSPAAYTRFQLSVKELVKLYIADPQDSTPYWLIATRKPELIAELINDLKRA
jgi:hypothetical protein